MNKKMYFDYSLKTLEERVEFIKDSQVLKDAVAEDERIKYYTKTSNEKDSMDSNRGGDNRYLEAINTYLFRSNDIESERKIEYSFYRDENKFKSKEIKNIYLSTIEGDNDTSDDSDYDRDVFDVLGSYTTNNNTESIYDIEYLLKKSDYINRLNMLRMLNEIDFSKESLHVKDSIREFIADIYSKCSDETDEQIVVMTSKGMSTQEIADKLNIGNTTVKRRLKKVLKIKVVQK